MMSDYSYIGKTMKRYREKCGFSQAEMADYCDVSRGTIVRIENGATECPAIILLLYAKKCHINLNTLAGTNDKYDTFTRQLVCLSNGLSQQAQNTVIDLLTILSSCNSSGGAITDN